MWVVLIGILTVTAVRATDVRSQESQAVKGDYAQVNGIKMYYEIHGSGSGIPLVLLNGGGSTINVPYGRVLPGMH